MSGGKRRRSQSLARTTSERLEFPGQQQQQQEQQLQVQLVEYRNAAQFESIKAKPLVLFYKDNDQEDNPTIFDPELDEYLIELHAEPYAIDETALETYMACVTRATYECRAHPDQANMLAAVRDETVDADPETTVVLVYMRDSAVRSVSRNRRANPFRNTINGLVDGRASPALMFFTQYSFEPYYRAQIIWHREPAFNATIGLIAVRFVDTN